VEEKFSYETVSENLVRQFVAVPLESDASIESQLLKKGKISELKGGLQFEFYELYDREFFLTKDKKIIPNNITISEKFKVGDTFYIISSKYKNVVDDYFQEKRNQIYIKES